MNRPQTGESAPWTVKYTDLVGDDVIDILEKQADQFADFVLSLRSLENYAYAPGKWTIKELIGHLIDTERILVYRLMSFSRGESQMLPNYDEDHFVANAESHLRILEEMAEEFRLLRKSNMYLFKSLSDNQLDKIGASSGNQTSVRSLVFVCAGHIIHHVNVIKERYL